MQWFGFANCTGVTPDKLHLLACRMSAAGRSGVNVAATRCHGMGPRAAELLAGVEQQHPGVAVIVLMGDARTHNDMDDVP